MKLRDAPFNQIVCFRDKIPPNQIRETFYIRRSRPLPSQYDPAVYCSADRLMCLFQAFADDLDNPRVEQISNRICSDPGVVMGAIEVIPLLESYFADRLPEQAS